jgi:hypothetical protein
MIILAECHSVSLRRLFRVSTDRVVLWPFGSRSCLLIAFSLGLVLRKVLFGMCGAIARKCVRASALHNIHRQPTPRGFFVFGLHVGAGFAHGFDHFV